MAILPIPHTTVRPMAVNMELTTSGKQPLTNRLAGAAAAVARATRAENTAWNTAVALSPPSATSRAQALPASPITAPPCRDAACTTTRGASRPIRSCAAPALARSTAWVVTSSGRANMWARARAAVAIQASRGALRPAMARRTGTSVAMARSQAMRWAKLPLPKIRMSQALAMCSSRCREASAGGRLGSRQGFEPILPALSAPIGWPRQGTREMARTSADVAIIGGGLIGAFAAFFLRQHRRSVIVIEKATAAAAASGRNFGNLRLQGHDPLEYPLALRAQAIWEALPRLTGEDCGLRGCGHAYLALGATDVGKLDTIVHQGQAAGLAIEHLDGAAARRRWPWLAPLVIGASWSGSDAVAEPKRASPAVVRLAVGRGEGLIER